ncbi:MAG: hypothetical protein M3410_03860 [Acidobacteriota bacterium]|nr:hypothetical protein [Acidobacteriota bacterium]
MYYPSLSPEWLLGLVNRQAALVAKNQSVSLHYQEDLAYVAQPDRDGLA